MKLSKGFTLIELIVVLAVFLVIIGVALTIFISIVSHQRRILAQQELLNQASYFIEYVGKGLRMAVKDDAGTCIAADSVYQLEDYNEDKGIWTGIKFINASDNNVCKEFRLEFIDSYNESLGYILKEISATGYSTNITSTNLKINSLSFSLNGVAPSQDNDHVPIAGDNSQPRVTIFLDIQAQGDTNQPSTKVQITVSQRNINPNQ